MRCKRSQKDVPLLTASPDRSLDENLLLEAKFTSKDAMITTETVSDSEDAAGTLLLKQYHDYNFHLQGQLLWNGHSDCKL